MELCVDMCLYCLEEEVYTTTVKAEQCDIGPGHQSFVFGTELALSSDFARSRKSRRKIFPAAL